MENTSVQGDIELIFGRPTRKFRRARIDGFVCQLAENKSVFKGAVEELSAQGFSMSKVPELFCDEAKIYRAIFSEGDNYYKIIVVPRWSKLSPDGKSFTVGYRILDNDWKWVRFSMRVLPVQPSEFSGSVQDRSL
jgi:hypothetical protein